MVDTKGPKLQDYRRCAQECARRLQQAEAVGSLCDRDGELPEYARERVRKASIMNSMGGASAGDANALRLDPHDYRI
jgi:hypothetical protein